MSAGPRPAMQCMSVDLPDPDGPMTAVNSPRRQLEVDAVDRPHGGVILAEDFGQPDGPSRREGARVGLPRRRCRRSSWTQQPPRRSHQSRNRMSLSSPIRAAALADPPTVVSLDTGRRREVRSRPDVGVAPAPRPADMAATRGRSRSRWRRSALPVPSDDDSNGAANSAGWAPRRATNGSPSTSNRPATSAGSSSR